MPTRIKIILSLIISAVALGGYLFQDYLGQTGPKYAALVVGLLMVAGMWIFPEVTGKKGAK